MPITSDDIAAALLAWDGKHTDVLVQVHSDFREDECYPNALAALCGCENPVIQEAASWLILQCGKSGIHFGPAISSAISGSMSAESTWAHALHICQAVKYLDLSKADALLLLPKLRVLSDHKRPFVRAWALDAAAVLANRHGNTLKTVARGMLHRAANDPAASVRARIRNLKL